MNWTGLRKGDQVKYFNALYRQNLLIFFFQSSAFTCGLMILCSFARHHRPNMLCNDIGWQEQSMWELKLPAGSTQLLELNNRQRKQTENTSNEHLDPGFYAKSHWLTVIIHWPMQFPEAPWGRAWAPDCQPKNREITDTVSQLTSTIQHS